ncbi:MAG: hypothetical protein AB9882_00495 [Ignavibacteriaceae bacterium]
MKNKVYSILSILLVTVVLFSGCNKNDDNPLDPGGNNNTGGNKSGQPIPTIANTDGVMATIGFSFTVPGVPISVDYVMGYALFGLPNGVNAGAVSVNGNNLPYATSNGVNYYNSFSQTNPSSLSNVSFNGSQQHTWTVAGGNGIPAINEGLVSPNTFEITAPVSGAIITKANALNVTWTNTTTTDSMMIVMVSLAGGNPYISSFLTNNGSFTIPEASMNAFPAGDAILQVVKFRYKVATVSGKNYAIVAEIVKSVTVKLQ